MINFEKEQGLFEKSLIHNRHIMDMEIQPVPWWNRRSRMERRFCILTGSLVLISLGLAIGLGGVFYRPDFFFRENDSIMPKNIIVAPLHELDQR